ncbi:MAG: mechanosensitive ion channel family protein, partial [Halobacteriota archaeon]|nr:mechanosensitive ion channel family protein [Halobacteriota archaeon]
MILEEVAYGDVTYLDLLISALVLITSVLVAKTITMILQRFLRDKVGKDHLNNILKFSYYTVIIIAIIMILPLLGIESSGLLVAGGIGGIVLGFASQSVVSNLLSGVFLMFERPIKIGDTVSVEGTVGVVEDIKIISTSIRTFDGVYVRIPNDKVFTTSITNYVTNVARRFEYVVGIRYSDDADEAIRIIKD